MGIESDEHGRRTHRQLMGAVREEIDLYGVARAVIFGFVWLLVTLPLMFVFLISAETAFEYHGEPVPWWFSQWVALSLIFVMMVPPVYVTIREVPAGERK